MFILEVHLKANYPCPAFCFSSSLPLFPLLGCNHSCRWLLRTTLTYSTSAASTPSACCLWRTGRWVSVSWLNLFMQNLTDVSDTKCQPFTESRLLWQFWACEDMCDVDLCDCAPAWTDSLDYTLVPFWGLFYFYFLFRSLIYMVQICWYFSLWSPLMGLAAGLLSEAPN